MADGPGFTALVVEDEPLIALDTEDMLRGFGATEVVIADDFAGAEARLTGCRYGVVVFDLDLGGHSTAPLVRACVERGCKAVVISGADSVPDVVDEAVPVLSKPVSRTDLRAALDEAGLRIGA